MGFTITVSFGKAQFQRTVGEDDKVGDLQKDLEAETGVIARKQKLIFKGRVLDPGQRLHDAKVKAGSKILMISSTAIETRGQEAARAAAQQKAAAAKARAEELRKAAAPLRQRQNRAGSSASGKTVSLQERLKTWQKTKILPLRDQQLEELPEEVLTLSDTRVIDLCWNCLTHLGDGIAQLTKLCTIRLSHNRLTTEGLASGLFRLQELTYLELEDNNITSLDGIGGLQRLRLLNASRNQLCNLPNEVSTLTSLQLLNVECNQLQGIPEALGHCAQLVDLLLDNNTIQRIPDEVSKLTNLRCLSANKNRISTVPASLLRCCTCLRTLNLHDNPVTTEQLRETEGYEDFEERRKGKYDKIIDMDVMFQEFDEGADAPDWRR